MIEYIIGGIIILAIVSLAVYMNVTNKTPKFTLPTHGEVPTPPEPTPEPTVGQAKPHRKIDN